MKVYVFIQYETEVNNKVPFIILAKSQEEFEKKVTEYLEDRFESYYAEQAEDEIEREYLNVTSKESYADYIIDYLAANGEIEDPNDDTIMYYKEIKTI